MVNRKQSCSAMFQNYNFTFPRCLCDLVVKAVQMGSKIYKIIKSAKKLQILLIFILIIVAWNGRVNICDLILNA
jgi:hypothetical protein